MLCGQARDGEFLERCELGNGLVPLSQAFLELGDLGLESSDLRDPRVDDLSGLLLGPPIAEVRREQEG